MLDFYRIPSRLRIVIGLMLLLTTAGVFALGLVTLVGSHYIVPEKLFPVLAFLSGATVVVIGLQQLVSRWRKALNHHHYYSDGINDHDHSQNDLQDHSHDQPPEYEHTHSHGGPAHSHLSPTRVTWRSLLALGISGGLLPCPSALVVLLSAIALHRIGYGLLLVVAFSLGLASVLTGVGLAFVYTRRFLERPLLASSGRLWPMLPVVSALVITCAGAAICYQALAQSGISIERIAAAIR